MTTNAIHSLYGASTLAGNVGGQMREQETLTPDDLLEVVCQTWGKPAYDPCASTDPSMWFADWNRTLPPVAAELQQAIADSLPGKARLALQRELKALYLALPPHGAGYAYVNPPYAYLEPWMRWCQSRRAPTLGLWPVRTHRPWWIDACRGAEIVLLRYDVRFRGHKSAFPAPLCLVSYGFIVKNLGKRETGRWRP